MQRDAEVRLSPRAADLPPGIGEEGFRIRSVSPDAVEIAAGNDAGCANGVYDFMVKSRVEQLTDPFSHEWDVQESPGWAERRVAVAAYVMGLTRLTPDMWDFTDWKAYVDFLRGLNAGRLTIMGVHQYHPEAEETQRNQWRLDNYRKLIAYAHEQGMKINLLTCYNQVPPSVYWRHPEGRTEPIRGYFGNVLCWSKAKDIIMKHLVYLMEYLEGLDGIEIMVTEPLGWCLCERCAPNMAAVWVDAVKEIGTAFRRVNPKGEIVFWNWLMAYLPVLRGIYPPTTKAQNLDRFQGYVLENLPEDTVLMDLSKNQVRISHGERFDFTGSDEILETGAAKGFQTINYMFYMDKEFGMVDRASIFPKPFLDMTVEEFEYTEKLPVSGVCSYRLAPPGRFLSDFLFLRMAWDPGRSREEIVNETAGYLSRGPEDRKRIAEAVGAIERYWHERRREDLVSAARALGTASSHPAYLQTVRLRKDLEILTMVDEYARITAGIEEARKRREDAEALIAKREEKLREVFEVMKGDPLYQGFTADALWEPRAIAMQLRPRMDMWANYINHRGYYD